MIVKNRAELQKRREKISDQEVYSVDPNAPRSTIAIAKNYSEAICRHMIFHLFRWNIINLPIEGGLGLFFIKDKNQTFLSQNRYEDFVTKKISSRENF